MTGPTDNAEFNQVAEQVKTLTSKPDNDTLLKLYAYFKQTTVGDNTTDAPGMFDFTGKAKWTAWNDIKGLPKDQAMAEYIQIAKDTIAKHS
jgi:diazepam-binding inhibitor (GABA receptor modulating acyl-CoA-binding protein)